MEQPAHWTAVPQPVWKPAHRRQFHAKWRAKWIDLRLSLQSVDQGVFGTVCRRAPNYKWRSDFWSNELGTKALGKPVFQYWIAAAPPGWGLGQCQVDYSDCARRAHVKIPPQAKQRYVIGIKWVELRWLLKEAKCIV